MAAPVTTARPSPLRRGLGMPISDNAIFLIPASVVIAVVAIASSSLGEAGWARTFAIIFTSITIEALPFILIGALFSALIAVYVPERVFASVARLPLGLQIPGATLCGLAFPVCECGSVPVARGLAGRGLHPAAAVSFMLAAPIVNPIVIASTVIAFQGAGGVRMAVARVGLGLVLAVAAGLLTARRGGIALVRHREPAASDHDHGHHGSRARRVVDHAGADVGFMGRFVILGAALSALIQTAVPQSVITDVLASAIVGVLLLMLLAFVLSLCSESDAFVAASFVQFSPSAQLAFLVLGPALDVKLSILYGASFGRRFVVGLAIVAVPLVFAGSLLVGQLL